MHLSRQGQHRRVVMSLCVALPSHAILRCDSPTFAIAKWITRGTACAHHNFVALERNSQYLSSQFLSGKLFKPCDTSVARERTLDPRRISATITMGLLVEPVEVLVKANTSNPAEFGDCPFSHRVILTLEEKKIPYDMKLVDTSNKPPWFLEVNPEGKVPVIKVDGKWQPDSDIIVKILEEEKPEPSLIAPEDVSTVGAKLFGATAKFLKSNVEDEGLKSALLSELKALDEHLNKTTGAFVGGKNVSQKDLELAPKLYALRVAGKHFKNFEIPSDLTAVHAYVKALEDLDSFKKTKCTEEAVIAGWAIVCGIKVNHALEKK